VSHPLLLQNSERSENRRRQEVVEGIDQSILTVTELLEKSVQLWTHLLEDGSLQELQEKETNIHAAMVEVKQ
jgi:hypothetical protein